MTLKDVAKLYWESNKRLLDFGHQFSKNDPKRTKYHHIPVGVPGIYFIHKHGADPLKDTPFYIGQTGDCITKRIKNHRRSLQDPKWKNENTGNFFIAANIDLEQTFDIYYIEAALLDLHSKLDREQAEELFIRHLKPTYRYYEV